jgi:hypothetical protein
MKDLKASYYLNTGRCGAPFFLNSASLNLFFYRSGGVNPPKTFSEFILFFRY